MAVKPIPFFRPWIGEEEIAEVVDTLRSDWITTGPKVARFEEDFRQFVDAPAALALNSCTAALHVALAALGIGPGDGVITTALTFCSGVHVIEQVGAQPILVDVEPDTLNLDPEQVKAALKKHANVKAILPTHLYGHPCEMDALMDIAREYGLAVIEDAAHALPARYRGRMIGAGDSSVPLLTCFSFYATKNLTTGEGGMLTGPPELIDEARIWSLHGMSRDAWKRYGAQGKWEYEVTRPGFKYNMTDLQAALGLHQLRRLPEFVARRREIVHTYNQAFSELPELELPAERAEVEHAFHLYVLRLRTEMLNISREQFFDKLRSAGVSASVHFIPIHLHAFYRDKYGFEDADFPVAHGAYERMISLPLFPRMSDAEVQTVIAAVREIVQGRRLGRSSSARVSAGASP